MSLLRFGNISALPLIHGRLAFAAEARRILLSERFDAIAVELPESLKRAVLFGIEALPAIHVLVYGVSFDAEEHAENRAWFVPIDPCDGIIEALRIGIGERTPLAFIDAEVEDFEAHRRALPDPHALEGLGLERWIVAVSPTVESWLPSQQDLIREAHMAARLTALSDEFGPERRILFVGGLAHWTRIRDHLEHGSGRLAEEAEGPSLEQIWLAPVHPQTLLFALGEMPWMTWKWEEHRRSIDPVPFRPADGLRDLLLEAKSAYEAEFPDTLEAASPSKLRGLLDYARRLTVSQGRLLPDTFNLTLAAKGTVGNDFAVKVLEVANRYPVNRRFRNSGLPLGPASLWISAQEVPATPRTPGEPRHLRPLSLRRRPPKQDAARWRRAWNPHDHCSWPPEDLIIEHFREYVTRRALTLAGMSLHRTEPFSSSFKDGIALRETLRDWTQNRIHVKEEPRVAGDVGALVLIFEEDDAGTQFPWRTTWMAEHPEESTLAFYSTDPRADIIGPGVGRIFYGGCLFLYPPLPIPDIWQDLRFERARRPSERLILAALYWSRDRFVTVVSARRPAAEVQAQAQSMGRHIVYLPLSSFSAPNLEKLRRAHVLNGREVRSWASRFIS